MEKNIKYSSKEKKMRSTSSRINKYTNWKQAGLSKPPIKVKGKMGKPQRKTGRNSVKKVSSSTVDAYEDDVSKLRGAKIREEKETLKVNMAPKCLDQNIPNGVRRIMLAQEESGISHPKRFYVSNDGTRQPFIAKRKRQLHQDTIINTVEPAMDGSLEISKNKAVGKEFEKKVETRKQEKAREYRKKQLAKKKNKGRPPVDDATEFSDLIDDVGFGEVTSRPPLNLAKPRNSESDPTKATRYQSLKLTGLLKSDSTASSQAPKSLHHKYVMAGERQRVIDLYRAQNKSKYKHLI